MQDLTVPGHCLYDQDARAYDPEFNVKEFWLHLKWLGVQNFLVTQLPKVHPKMFKPIMATIPQSL